MQVIHKFFGVGHGAFVSGQIGAGRDAFNFVYDCGSKAPKRIARIVQKYSDSISQLNAIFISHFDQDHVSNIAQLIDYFGKIDDVYIPHLMPDEVIFAAASALASNDEGTFPDIEMIVDPVGWFTSRGVRRVNFVGRGPGEFGAEDGPAPTEPSLDLEDKGESRTKAKPVRCQPDRRDVLSESPSERTLGPSPTLRTTVQADEMPWILKPHCYAPDEGTQFLQRAIAKEVRRVMGLGNKSVPILKDFRSMTTDQRATVRSVYISLLPSSQHNIASMSLYSGPPAETHTHYRSNIHVISTEFYRGMELDSYRRDYINSPAWIGTGDAELKSEKIFSQWAQAYEPLLDRIGIFSLPHHGSQGNFSEDILNRVRARFFVSHSKALGKNRHHPNASVIQALQRDGRFCAYCDGVETPVVWHVVFQI